MEKIKIATVQFEHRSNDKAYNLKQIESFARRASEKGVDAIAFHECSITGYTFAQKLNKEELLGVAEEIPGGPSVEALQNISKRNNNITLLAGLFERQGTDIYKAYVAVNHDGLVAKYRKLHPFINPHILPGNEYVTFDLKGWKCSILICYDNNIQENVRAVKLLGAEIIFMPHVTMCTPSTRPGAGFVDPELWYNREQDPTSLRKEFDGLKGREWLMKWLPARAYDNAIYAIFSNPIGMDDDQLKNGCSMIIDPFGDIIAECRALDDDYVMATLAKEKLTLAGGHRYLQARRPELYGDLVSQPHNSEQKVSWLNKK
ncbi:MAG: nitrilase family protein [Cyclobacteriaceae bacterium]|nr:nitrilase family protein [Cyclobacteriaceae bacterium]